MNHEVIRAIASAIVVALWLDLLRSAAGRSVSGAALFFASIAAFSQNFAFIFREIHQAIQILLIVAVLPSLVSRLRSFNWIFIGLLALIGVSIVKMPFDSDAQSQLINIVAAAGVTNYLFHSIKSQDDFDVILKFIGRIAIALSVVGVLERFLGVNERIEVTFANPNYLGLYLGIGFCCVHQKSRGVFRMIGLLTILAALVITGSRAALLLPILMILWSAIKTKGFRGFISYFFIVSLAVGALLVSGASRLSDSDAGQASDAERLIFARIALNMAIDHPLTGVGWGRFISEFENYSSSAEKIILDSGVVDVAGQDRRVTHNDFLRILAELGFLALVLSVGTVLVGAWMLLRLRHNSAQFLPPIWIGLLIFSLAHNNLNTAFFWFFFLLPFVMKNVRNLPVKGDKAILCT